MFFARIDRSVALTSIITAGVVVACAPGYDSPEEMSEAERSGADRDAASGQGDRARATQMDAATGGEGGTGARIDAALTPSGDGGVAPANDGGANPRGVAEGPPANFSFFVTSDRSMTGDLGGLAGADARCEALASAVGAGDRQWRAYLSIEGVADPGSMQVDARDRIGEGPWYNAEGVLVARDVDDLHARKGDADLFTDERGNKINGQWDPTLKPNEHDILTGSDANGRVLAGKTCEDWTSSASNLTAQVGHSDGLGPDRGTSNGLDSWNSAHANRGCNDTAPAGGAGRIYCFAAD